MAIGLASVLGVGLPLLLGYIHMSADVGAQGSRMWSMRSIVQMTTVVVMFTTCSLYVSSSCTGGVRALVLSIPTAFAGVLFVQAVPLLAASIAYWFLKRRIGGPNHFVFPTTLIRNLYEYGWFVIAFGLVALVLRLALQNHRSAERSPARIFWQAIWIVGYCALGVLLLAGLEIFLQFRLY
jgi:hypothetical protein